MFEDYQICPYTGLRSFTEDESLYFKGREEHIEQATEQLRRNKFLMLTGASGDGKSSLVYAGIVPNARAGFLKSKYTQWSVADFRPERTPFLNLCRSISRQLGIANPHTVEAELQHGFSALVDLYKNSKCFVDVDSISWKTADESERAALKRSASNLIIIVDQFEEFFTNPENYHLGVPSRDSNLVLNVLLETARIGLEEDLPIYIVFTMRSDYIGQCAAFRSLPEYIGFSQFFVPRLNRSQLQQVIEEPATLSGNSISRRLTERLIHDIAEGVDQLPILQHALNQIWHATNTGKEEMDLIHYAMVGGMPAAELPDDQVSRFKQWFNVLPEKIKQFYREPNLQNVLDTHANKLFESAAETYRAKSGKELTDSQTRAIIKLTFTCLTKIDQSRAVRNRMTLREIHSILNHADVSMESIGLVLRIFREPGNTFIRPFITEDSASGKLGENDVLDITHESLIRNWEFLETWAKEEFDNYTISLDFEKQLNRWVESGKSSGFLLSIGPLTYFETWYNKVNPNVWWIARYLPEDIEQSKKLEKAKVVLGNAEEFIKQSARKHLVTRTIMHYGPKRIAAVFALIGFLTLSSFVVRNYLQQQNAYILNSIKEQAFQLSNSPKVALFDRSFLLTELLKSGSLTVDDILGHAKDSLTRIQIPARTAALLLVLGRNEPKAITAQALVSIDKAIEEYGIKVRDAEKTKALMVEVNYFGGLLNLASVVSPSVDVDRLRKKNADRSVLLIKQLLQTQPESFKAINEFHTTLEQAINRRALSEDDLRLVLKTLSPFENSDRSGWVQKNYHRDNLGVKGGFDYGFKFNALFQELAYVYAALGDTDKTLQCVDTLLKYSQNYFQNDYTYVVDNATNIAAVFYVYDKQQQFTEFVTGYCQRKNMAEPIFYQRLMGRSSFTINAIDPLNEPPDYLNTNLQFGGHDQMKFIAARYREAIEKTIPDADSRNFHLALSYKDEALLRFTLMDIRGQNNGSDSLRQLFDQAMTYYRRVRDQFLDEAISVPRTADNDAFSISRKFLFLYPDYHSTFSLFEARNIYNYFNSVAFINYIIENKLLNELYSDAELSYFTWWLESYSVRNGNRPFSMRNKVALKTWLALEAALATRNASSFADLNILYLTLGNETSAQGQKDEALAYYSKLNLGNMMNLLRNAGPGAPEANAESFCLIANAIAGLTKFDHIAEAYGLVKLFKNPINRSSLYAFAANELLEKKVTGPFTQQLLDSARKESTRIENLATGQPNRQIISYALVMKDPEANTDEAYKTIKNIGNKIVPTLRISRAYAFHGNLFDAMLQVPENSSDGDQANFLWNVLYGYGQGKETNQPEWAQFNNNYLRPQARYIIYVNESN